MEHQACTMTYGKKHCRTSDLGSKMDGSHSAYTGGTPAAYEMKHGSASR